MKASGAPFYSIYNVGEYTFAPYKVAWAEMSGSLAAAVVGPQNLTLGLETKPVVPDHKIYFVACANERMAHFLCALMNSEPVKAFVDSFTCLSVVEHDNPRARIIAHNLRRHTLDTLSFAIAFVDRFHYLTPYCIDLVESLF
jgi:hypothetical protein